MKSLISTRKSLLFVLVIIIAAIIVPALTVGLRPAFHNPVTQILFDIILAAASVWLGDAISKEQAKKQATDKWIPAAESASRALLAMSATIDRMKRKRGKTGEALSVILENIPDKQRPIVDSVIRMRCGSCSEGLSNLRFHVDNIFSDWGAFIETNCDEMVCEEIHKRLDERREELKKITEQDFKEIVHDT